MIIVVIPCFQGATSVGKVVRGAKASGLPVVVVDDGSTDDSSGVAEAAGATVLRHPVNRGKGAAIASGFVYAKQIGAAAVLTMDADGQHDPAEIGKLVAAHVAEPRALVVGVRSFAPEDMPRRSRIGNRISTWWISRYAGRTHRDTQSGFRLYPRALFDVPLISTRFETESELLLRAAKLELPLQEVPIRTIYDVNHASHFHGFRDTMRVIKLVFFSPLWMLLAALVLHGCAHPKALVVVHGSAPVMPVTQSWHTMRAEHKVALDVKLASGAHDKRELRGLIAVERPDRFRLRALGPGGITLFDLVDVQGQVRVLESLKDPNSSSLQRILESLAGDLQAAFDLAPRPTDRRVGKVGQEVVVEESGRVVRETPRTIDIDNKTENYKVHVDVSAVEKDVLLDPQMWSK
jgi:hypothetical protein